MRTEWVKDKTDAVIKVREARKNNIAYDLVIIDTELNTLDIKEYVMRVRSEFGADLPILFTCGYDCDEINAKTITSGMNAFVQKPLFKSKLCQKLSLLAGQKNGEQKEETYTNDFDFSGCRILLVEDNELNREIASELLSATHANVETACNGEEALHSFENAPVGYYTLIFMDIQMPVMDGYSATRKIRKLNRLDAETIPIIALSANAFTEDIAACIEAGMNAHLAKPLDMQLVQKTIQAYMLQKK